MAIFFGFETVSTEKLPPNLFTTSLIVLTMRL
ncbi:uncharacterized protein METZ01_LOCUS309766, partial [marine metagenome]